MHSITIMSQSYFEPMVTLKWDIILIFLLTNGRDLGWLPLHLYAGKRFRTSKCYGSVTKTVRVGFPDSKPKYCKSGREEWVKCDLILGQCWRGSEQSIPKKAILEQWATWNIFSSESNGATRHARKTSNGSLLLDLSLADQSSEWNLPCKRCPSLVQKRWMSASLLPCGQIPN